MAVTLPVAAIGVSETGSTATRIVGSAAGLDESPEAGGGST